MYIRPVGDKYRVEVEKYGHRPSKLCDSYAEAHRWGQAKEAEFEALKGSKGRNFAGATAHYLRTVSPHKVDAVEWECRRFEHMATFFGAATPLAKIDSAKVGQWRDWRLAQGVKGSTVLREANLLRNLFRLAHREWKWISENPTEGVRWPEGSEDKELVWSWRDIRKLLRYAQRGGPKQQEVGAAFHIALRTAMRLNEVIAARPLGLVAVLPRQKTSGKDAKPVKVPLTRHGRRLLAKAPEWTVGANEASVLFSDMTEQLGIRTKGERGGLTFHDSRATALTHLARKVDVLTLSKISRHRDINILRRKYYRESAEAISARL